MNPRNKVEAQSESLPSVPIPLGEDAEALDAPDHIFTENAFT